MRDSWPVLSFQDLLDASILEALQDGNHGNDHPKASEYVAAGIPFIMAKDLRNGRLDITGCAFLSRERADALRIGFARPGDVLLSHKGTVGAVAMVPEGYEYVMLTPQVTYYRIKDRNRLDANYLVQALRAPAFQRRLIAVSAQSTRSYAPIGIQKTLLIPMPKIAEQRRIANLLSVWDLAIEKIDQLIAAKELMFQSLLVRTFERTFASHSDLTETKHIFESVSNRGRTDLPLLAVMQDIGIVRRDELDRRVVMPEGDGSTYKVVSPGDFVISLRSFEGGLEYSDIEGLVSPAYTVLRPKADIDARYYRHFFKSKNFIRRLDRLIFGIRDGKQIDFHELGDMKIPSPNRMQQQLIADQLDTAKRNVELSRLMATKLDRQKQGLMQKLLTGEWRVPVRDGDVDAMATRVVVEVAQ